MNPEPPSHLHPKMHHHLSKKCTLSTEAAHSLVVSSAVERPPHFALPLLFSQSHLHSHLSQSHSPQPCFSTSSQPSPHKKSRPNSTSRTPTPSPASAASTT